MGVRYIQDQNKLVYLAESGVYAVSSGAANTGLWIGEVTDSSVDDTENLLQDRFLGASTRSFTNTVGGPRDVTGTFEYNVQNLVFPFFAIGSVNDAGAANHYVHYANQVNTASWQNPFVSGTSYLNGPISFTLEDSKTSAGSLFTRTLKGCVINSATITAAQGEKVKCAIDWIGQTSIFSGGTSTLTVTRDAATPYVWNNCSLACSGITMDTAKEIGISINNNIEGPHYLNGSRDISVPYPGNRENTMTITIDLDSIGGNHMYGLYKNDAVFNSTFDMNADTTAGSQHTIFFLSGCRINSMDVPGGFEGTAESTIEIICPTIIGSACDNIPKYCYW